MPIVINTMLLMKKIFEISICLSPSLWNNLKYIMDMTFSDIHFLQNSESKLQKTHHKTYPKKRFTYSICITLTQFRLNITNYIYSKQDL